ncbi:MAG TPA: GAF and ANTAR domain-containing protein [Egibacteraceae bacterium]|nr:GAF and ANTAR domain-containing protein [Egibacteraceae bacterium]
MSDRERALHDALATFVRRMTQDYDVGDVLDLLAGQVPAVMGVEAGGVTLVDPKGTTAYAAASDPRAQRTEQLETTLDQGPCIACIADREIKVVPDLLRETRWPAYGEAARQFGWRTVLGVPLMAGDRCIGGLDIYGEQPRDWTREELEHARLLADMATSYIVHARALEESRTLAAQLQNALHSRVVIEQAKGMLAATLDLDVDQAFELLRTRARSTNVTLRSVAQRVVEGRGAPQH